MRQIVHIVLLFQMILFSTPLSAADPVERPIIQLSIQGVIGPATDDYISRSLETASDHHAALVIIKMDTPGGLDTSMRGIIKAIINSPVPVVTYVSPSGARAASAGTYILYASHIAAMAPGTNLGAATPVRLGGFKPFKPAEKPNGEKPAAMSDEDAMKNKIINDAVAYIRSMAQLRKRNQQWAEKAVREGASLPAIEALKKNVIDIVAPNMSELLKLVDGREVNVLGESRRLKVLGLVVKKMEPDWRSRLLSVITNPNVAYILMMIGIYGLIFEFSNPGAIVPGTVGAIALLLALYALQLLPVNYAGIGLLLLGVALMIGEAFQPSFGVLGIGGVIAFIIGSIILIDTNVPGFGINISVIITFAISSVLMFVIVIGMAIKSRRRPVVSGMEELYGGIGIVSDNFENDGWINIHSEKWQAISDQPLTKGQRVQVTGNQGLKLRVEPVTDSTQENL